MASNQKVKTLIRDLVAGVHEEARGRERDARRGGFADTVEFVEWWVQTEPSSGDAELIEEYGVDYIAHKLYQALAKEPVFYAAVFSGTRNRSKFGGPNKRQVVEALRIGDVDFFNDVFRRVDVSVIKASPYQKEDLKEEIQEAFENGAERVTVVYATGQVGEKKRR